MLWLDGYFFFAAAWSSQLFRSQSKHFGKHCQ